MLEISTEDFIASLDKSNNNYDELVIACESHRYHIERKSKNMLDTIERLSKCDITPIVDKKFQLIFGCREGNHAVLRTSLYRYHRGYVRGADTCSDLYLSENLGWYISTMQPHVIIVGVHYRPDRFDKDLFEEYKLHPF